MFSLYNLFSFNIISFSDVPEDWQMTPQDPATKLMEGIINFHNFLLCIIIAIGVAVGILLVEVLIKFNSKANPTPIKFAHASVLEIVWTIIPAIILVFIAGPSFSLLYSQDESYAHAYTYKVIGHQWYWSYELVNKFKPGTYYEFDSYLVPLENLVSGVFRLLEVDRRLPVPVNTPLTFLITSVDVIHSWAIPSLGVKLDACPGRLAHISFSIDREGMFYGQCSEICGTGHGFMPIAVAALNFDLWYDVMVRYNVIKM